MFFLEIKIMAKSGCNVLGAITYNFPNSPFGNKFIFIVNKCVNNITIHNVKIVNLVYSFASVNTNNIATAVASC